MTYDIYRYIFYGGAGLAVLCFAVTIVLFFVLRIPEVIGYLTGSTARKAIEKIRHESEDGSAGQSEAEEVSRKRNKIGNVINSPVNKGIPTDDGAIATSKIGTDRLSSEAKQSYETSLLNSSDMNETTVLSAKGIGETTVIGQQKLNDFIIEDEIVFIHTDEIIC